MIKILKGDKSRSVGMVNLNLGTYLAQEKYEGVSCKIEKCPDKEATLVFSVFNTLINVTSGSETMSMMSGLCGPEVMSIDSGPDS